MVEVTRVVLVGHCGFDAGSLSSLVRRVAPKVSLTSVEDEHALSEVAGEESLLLVNRALDGGFDAEDGVALIATLAGSGSGARAMLISNYPDAQQRAEAAGAVPGFGKRDIGTPTAEKRLREALGI